MFHDDLLFEVATATNYELRTLQEGCKHFLAIRRAAPYSASYGTFSLRKVNTGLLGWIQEFSWKASISGGFDVTRPMRPRSWRNCAGSSAGRRMWFRSEVGN